ncbi:MAG: hypothetical protein U9M97_01485 [Candidatus Hadarchaeota archaeon]|nr:hypothetical protein [Candidatus Hadarchaeota archaeon]
MRERYWLAAFWVLVVGSWVFGVVYGRWISNEGFFLDLSQVVHIPGPSQLDAWWQPLVYFIFTVVAVFVLSQLFFGAGAAIFLFARGVYDSTLIAKLESTIGSWSFPDLPMNDICVVLLIALILTVNLPLCLWSAQLGTQRSVYMLQRLRGKPVRPELGTGPFSQFLIILAASIAIGLIAAFLFSYAQ